MNTRRIHGTLTALAALAVVAVLAVPAGTVRADDKLDKKFADARQAYQDLVESPDHEVPDALVGKCRCVAVIPGVVKGALGYGARFGQGVVSCRDSAGVWSAPSFVRITGGSFGFQIGAQSSDVVLFFMSERGARSLLDSKFTLGGNASVAAGPMGRSGEADTDLHLTSEIYSYSRSRGLFAGISLEGARLAPDAKANTAYYGSEISAETLLFGRPEMKLPAGARGFISSLP